MSGKKSNSLATRSNGAGKNISETLNPNNAPADYKSRALRRTLLANSLNTR